MTNPEVALLMLGLFIVLVLLGFPIAFTLLAMGVGFGYYAYHQGGSIDSIGETWATVSKPSDGGAPTRCVGES